MSLLFYSSSPSVYFVSFTSSLTSNIVGIALADTQLHLIYSEDINTSIERWVLFITANKQWHCSSTLIQETWKLLLIRVQEKTSSYTDRNILLSFWQSAVKWLLLTKSGPFCSTDTRCGGNLRVMLVRNVVYIWRHVRLGLKYWQLIRMVRKEKLRQAQLKSEDSYFQ